MYWHEIIRKYKKEQSAVTTGYDITKIMDNLFLDCLYLDDVIFELDFEQKCAPEQLYTIECLDQKTIMELADYRELMIESARFPEPYKTFGEVAKMNKGFKKINAFKINLNWKYEIVDDIIRVPNKEYIELHILFLADTKFAAIFQKKKKLEIKYGYSIVEYGQKLSGFDGHYRYVFERLTGANLSFLIWNYFSMFKQKLLVRIEVPQKYIVRVVTQLPGETDEDKPDEFFECINNTIHDDSIREQRKVEQIIAKLKDMLLAFADCLVEMPMVLGRVIIADFLLRAIMNYAESSAIIPSGCKFPNKDIGKIIIKELDKLEYCFNVCYPGEDVGCIEIIEKQYDAMKSRCSEWHKEIECIPEELFTGQHLVEIFKQITPKSYNTSNLYKFNDLGEFFSTDLFSDNCAQIPTVFVVNPFEEKKTEDCEECLEFLLYILDKINK